MKSFIEIPDDYGYRLATGTVSSDGMFLLCEEVNSDGLRKFHIGWRDDRIGRWMVGESACLAGSVVPIAKLVKIESWRPATVDDAIRAIKGEDVPCRVSDVEAGGDGGWTYTYLTGYDIADELKWRTPASTWLICEVPTD